MLTVRGASGVCYYNILVFNWLLIEEETVIALSTFEMIQVF